MNNIIKFPSKSKKMNPNLYLGFSIRIMEKGGKFRGLAFNKYGESPVCHHNFTFASKESAISNLKLLIDNFIIAQNERVADY